jgi:uncharacterized protein (TIGR02147 family)
MKPRPNIFEFIDYKKFLTAWREAEKENNPGLTHEYLCAKLGQRNRTYFSDVEKGRKIIGGEVLDRLIKLMGLTCDEAKYFRAIVGYGQPATYSEKEYWFEQAIQLNNTPKKIVDKKTYAYFKRWYHSTVRAYLETCNFKKEYAEASRRLYGRVTPKEVKEAIKNLSAIGMIASNEEGYLKPIDKVLVTGDMVKEALIRCYHVSNIKNFNAVIESREPDAYQSRHLTVSVSDRGMERIINRINQLRSEILSIAHKDEEEAHRVYKIAIHTYPESRKD